MYLRNIKRLQGIYLVIQESYYDSSARQSRTRTVESLGYLEALKKQYDDPVAFFTQRVKEMTMQKKNTKSVSISIECGAKLSLRADDIKIAGYGILKELYKQFKW